MSLISKQVDELRAYANERKGELAKLISDAADTIELLSAKLSALNMERSSQYYHEGWIPCNEKLPRDVDEIEDDELVLVSDGEDYAVAFWRSEADAWDDPIHGWLDSYGFDVKAWMPLPDQYKEENKEDGNK